MGFSIGTIKIEEPVFLPPITGVTDLPFRRIVRRYGASAWALAPECQVTPGKVAPFLRSGQRHSPQAAWYRRLWRPSFPSGAWQKLGRVCRWEYSFRSPEYGWKLLLPYCRRCRNWSLAQILTQRNLGDWNQERHSTQDKVRLPPSMWRYRRNT